MSISFEILYEVYFKEYTELNEYMDGFERELYACDPITTGMPAKVLLAQQQHNNVNYIFF